MSLYSEFCCLSRTCYIERQWYVREVNFRKGVSRLLIMSRIKSPELRVRSAGIRLGKSDFPACWNSGLQMIKGHGYLALGSLGWNQQQKHAPWVFFQQCNSPFGNAYLLHYLRHIFRVRSSGWWEWNMWFRKKNTSATLFTYIHNSYLVADVLLFALTLFWSLFADWNLTLTGIQEFIYFCATQIHVSCRSVSLLQPCWDS